MNGVAVPAIAAANNSFLRRRNEPELYALGLDMTKRTAVGSDGWKERVLRLDLCEGDRDPYERLLAKKLLIARFGHQCGTCREKIKPGALYRRGVAVDGPELLTMATCCECLDAELDWHDGKYDRFEARINRGRNRRRR